MMLRRAIAAAALLALPACTVEMPNDADRAARFAPHIESYLDASALADEATDGGGYVKKKLVLVDLAKRAADVGLMTHLPPEIRALRPEEVGTVVWLEWGEEPGGTYEVKRTGQKLGSVIETCAITVIDREARKIVARKKVEGTLPDETKILEAAIGPNAKVVSDRPVAELHEFLGSLPRR